MSGGVAAAGGGCGKRSQGLKCMVRVPYSSNFSEEQEILQFFWSYFSYNFTYGYRIRLREQKNVDSSRPFLGFSEDIFSLKFFAASILFV